MKKRLLAALMSAVLLTTVTGCETLLNQKEPAVTEDPDTQDPEETPENNSGEETEEGEIDPSLIPILPEISSSEVESEPMEDDGRLNIVFLGDSQFENGTDSSTSIPDLVAAHTHARVYNLGIGGTCAALTVMDSTDKDNWDNLSFVGLAGMLKGDTSRAVLEGYSQYAVLESIDPAQVDYYVVSYGVNDFLNGIRAHIQGKESDNHNYYAALVQGIGTLKSISPNAQVILCTPVYTQFYNAQGAYIGDSHIHDYGIGVFDEYSNQASHVASGNCLLLDANSGRMFNLDGNTADAYLMDGIHLTEKGRQVYALALTYIIAKDRGWTERSLETIEIDHIDWAEEFLADIPE